MPATRPSAGVRAIRSSTVRRRRCAAITSGPYSTKVPGSQRSSTFSRAVRWRGLAAPLDRVGARRVERHGVAIVDSARSGRTALEVDFDRRCFGVAGCVVLVDEQERVALVHGVAGGDRDAAHDAAGRRLDHVLHLHRSHDEELLAGAHQVALGDVDADDRALHRRRDHTGAPSSSGAPALDSTDAVAALAVREHRERIVGVDLRAGERALLRSRGTRRRRAAARLEVEPRRAVARSEELRHALLDEARVHATGGEVRVLEQTLEQREVGRHSLDAELAAAPAPSCAPPPRSRATASARSAWRAASRSSDWCDSRRSRRCRRAAPGPTAARTRSACRRTGAPTVGRHRLHVHARLDRIAARLGLHARSEAGLLERGAARDRELEPAPGRRRSPPR